METDEERERMTVGQAETATTTTIMIKRQRHKTAENRQ